MSNTRSTPRRDNRHLIAGTPAWENGHMTTATLDLIAELDARADARRDSGHGDALPRKRAIARKRAFIQIHTTDEESAS